MASRCKRLSPRRNKTIGVQNRKDTQRKQQTKRKTRKKIRRQKRTRNIYKKNWKMAEIKYTTRNEAKTIKQMYKRTDGRGDERIEMKVFVTKISRSN